MKIKQAAKLWLDNHKSNSQKNTVTAYQAVFRKFCQEFGAEDIDRVTSDQILEFLEKITEGTKQQTKRIRYSPLSAFFNFIRANIDQDFKNHCGNPILKKMFKAKPIPL